MYESLEILKSYWSQIGFVISVFGSIYLYFKGRHKRKQEFKIGENQIIAGDIKNLSAIIKLQREVIEDIRKDFNLLKADYKARGEAYDNLEAKFNKVSETLDRYDRKIKSLYNENLELIKQVKQCEVCTHDN